MNEHFSRKKSIHANQNVLEVDEQLFLVHPEPLF